jgi:hypothetical protein
MASKSEKEKRGLTGTGEEIEISAGQFKITSSIAICAILVSVLIMFGGAFLAVYAQNEAKKETTAKLVYDDIDRMNWTLHNLTTMIDENPHGLPVIFTSIYSDNGIYYTSRSDIALLDDNLARNISIYYTDLGYAEIYRKSILDAIGPNAAIYAPTQINISYMQYSNAIKEANDLRPSILDDLERINHISKSPANRFNRY